ncbi:MAG TPA: LytTR family DNA-binding domain-containing protein, partial [Saprospiraceae bacterium]|nr:LytTR family DNA-binding domain-containing protein [Saprospiraceae bacterium]
HPPMVIFTTAYSNYALQSYELDAVDYLLKPISFERFMKAVNRAIEEQKLTVQAHQSHPEDTDEKDYIFIKADKKLVRVRFADIIYIEGLKDYVIIRLDQSRVITLQTMKSLEDKLPTPMFKRIHRSYIVNVNKIEAIVGNMVEVTEKGQTKHLPIGKNYRDELLQMINDNKL